MRLLSRIVAIVLLAAQAAGCRASSSSRDAADAATLRRQFHALIFQDRVVRPIVPTTILTNVTEGRRVERVRFESEPGEKVVAAIARPEKAEGRLPAVIVQHYLGGTKDDLIIQGLMW